MIPERVHVQYTDYSKLPYQSISSALSQWLFALYPAGITVSGNMGITFSIPPLMGSYDYIQAVTPYVLIVGLDNDSLQILPVGVGHIDTENKKVVSLGTTALSRLDYLGYAFVDAQFESILESYVNKEISLMQMISELESGIE